MEAPVHVFPEENVAGGHQCRAIAGRGLRRDALAEANGIFSERRPLHAGVVVGDVKGFGDRRIGCLSIRANVEEAGQRLVAVLLEHGLIIKLCAGRIGVDVRHL